MKKNYVLDTNVLLHDPYAIFKFEDNDLILPIYVIEEIDQFKRDSNERGRNARTVSRLLDALRNKGPLSGGVSLDEIDPATMESRVCPGLYLAGEVLDVDGRLGGFNFQWAWASGYVAGRGVAGS